MLFEHYNSSLNYEEASAYTVLLSDDERVDAYKRAIDEIVKQDMQVVELGSGPGVFGRYAANLGASVIMVEQGQQASKICNLLNQLLADGKPIVIEKSSIEAIKLPSCDVVIHELIGGRVFDEGLLSITKSFASNNKWFTRSDVQVIPQSIELWAKFIRVNTNEISRGLENWKGESNDTFSSDKISPLLWATSTSDYDSCSDWFKIDTIQSKEISKWATKYSVSNIKIYNESVNALLWGFVANLSSTTSLDARLGMAAPTSWGGTVELLPCLNQLLEIGEFDLQIDMRNQKSTIDSNGWIVMVG